MRLKGMIGVLLVMGGLQVVSAQFMYDTLWMVHDDNGDILWMEMFCSDTFPDSRGQFGMTDTGDSQDGSPYINFDYQFSTDSVRLKARSSDSILVSEPRPGYAGFKIYWDSGIMKFYAEDHDSMVLWHKGPLPGHKVKMVWAQGSAGCGTPINYQDYYEFKGTTEWTRESWGYPEGFVRGGLFELRFLITNDEGNDSPTSEPGCLKIDNAFFKKGAIAVRQPAAIPHTTSNSRFFVPTMDEKVTLTVFSLQGEQLFKGQVAVQKGNRYNVSKFARTNSQLPAGWIQCVHISGAGVNVKRKLFR